MFRYYSKYLPNALTCARGWLAEFFVSAAMYSFHEGMKVFFILAILAELTDLLDGKTARWLKIADPSGFGGIFDGFADMFWRSSVLGVLAYYSIIPPWLAVLFMLSDEFLLWVVRGWHWGFIGYYPPVRIWGKVKAGCIATAIMYWTGTLAFPEYRNSTVHTVLLWLAAVSIMVTLADHIWVYLYKTGLLQRALRHAT